ncbi:hypothetical protein MBSD_n0676 [Mizugakiibacter sediminis]|uniref:FAD:protein FMN transferase n=1 Tax=Mizugakiibacter sediminis TaxID=1475481 RepID=A0A0K8QLS3_9GAMM|nr:FAD:protein FMN transferase [Mizugakiibacter sediminis]GAP65387.1 hypothetical protein MBSD_n0676 [Mizugakiibacter sediminis]
MIARARPLLGTLVEIRARGDACAVTAAFAAVERVHALMSFHDPTSELSRLNREAARRALRVHPWTYRVLRAARRLHRLSDGAFDCSVAGASVAAGALPAPADEAPPATGMEAVELLPGFRVHYRRPLWLDLGGIAKGFAVDRAVDALRRHGATAAVVNAGGDLRVLGDEPQMVAVRDPQQPQRLLPLGALADGAIATSAPYFSESGGDWSIRDPAGGSPRRYRSVSVLAPSCLRADALTKIVWLRGAEASASLLARLRAQAVTL